MTTIVADTEPQGYILARVAVDPATNCWNWRLTLNWKGYGQAGRLGKTCLAHRVAYEAFTGPIPEGLQIDHLCRNRKCVNPAHLEAVTAFENWSRSMHPGAMGFAARKTHCHRGHDLADAYVKKDGARDCRPCRADRNRAASARKAATR